MWNILEKANIIFMWSILIALFGFLIFIVVSSGINTYQFNNSISKEKWQREFNIDRVKLSYGKYQNIVLTGFDENATIEMSVKEIPINKTKFVVSFETFIKPDGEEFTVRTFSGYK